MKKKLTYPLLALVILLWGVIFHRLFSGLGDRAEPRTTRMEPAKRPAAEPHVDDTLLLDYRDPFLGAPDDEVAATEEYLPMDNGYPEEIPYVDWSQVRYYGLVSGHGAGKTVALVHINGRDYMLKPGESVDGFTLLGSMTNTVKMSHQGQVASITIQGNDGEQFPLTTEMYQ
ncbi:hypothetical protein ACFOET_06935 [Parapedobacter deserti]|uniref:Uncharacterized protein n=1 Tax=Parapedobacter deserti TaxID=1912957 RepID=A0ABV7JJI2_9SPHI